MPTTVTDVSFEKDVLKAAAPVVVDFWAEWCGPCHAIAPALEELATELHGKVTIAKLNIDDNPRTAIKYGVRSIPTLIMFKNGEPMAMQVGAAPKSRLSDWIKKAI
jgi:thioredoxin 1